MGGGGYAPSTIFKLKGLLDLFVSWRSTINSIFKDKMDDKN